MSTAARIGAQIKRAREAIPGMTQQLLAEKSNLSQNYIAKIEIGIGKPSIDALDAIAEALRCDVGMFFQPISEPAMLAANGPPPESTGRDIFEMLHEQQMHYAKLQEQRDARNDERMAAILDGMTLMRKRVEALDRQVRGGNISNGSYYPGHRSSEPAPSSTDAEAKGA